MAEKSATRKGTQNAARSTKATASKGFTAEERAAMKERAQELKAEARKADGESAVLAKIAEMPKSDRDMAKRLHAIVKASAPDLSPKTWYGMPAYAKDGKVVCYFQSAHKFKSRYATFGFNDTANLDEGAMWPTSFALKELTAADEARISALVTPRTRPACTQEPRAGAGEAGRRADAGHRAGRRARPPRHPGRGSRRARPAGRAPRRARAAPAGAARRCRSPRGSRRSGRS